MYTFTDNGEYVFTLKDSLGNQSDYSVMIDNIDRDINLQISYSVDTYTNQDVVATVFSDEEELFASNNFKSLQYTFTENGEFTFEVYDKAGNTATIKAAVSWMNKVGVDFTVVPSTKQITNQPVTLSIEPPAQLGAVVSQEGLTPIDGTSHQFLVTEAGRYHFNVTDVYGNSKELSYYVGNVDMAAPTLEYTLGLNTAGGRVVLQEGEDISVLSQSIRIAFAAEEKVEFTDYDASLEYDAGARAFVAKANGTYSFTARDAAGNETSRTITLTGIDVSPPEVEVTYSVTTPTNQNVVASVSSNEEILVVNNYNSPNRLFTENGTYTFIVSDLAGNQVEVEAVVLNIDKKPPVIEVAYSTKSKTSQNVTATLTSDEVFYVVKDTVTKVEIGESYTYTFENNHTAFFSIKDEVGNETVVFAKVDHIDKQAPNIVFSSDKPLIVHIGETDYDFSKEAYSDSADTERIVADTSAVDFSNSGLYEVVYTAHDDAGNVSERIKLVDVIDPNEPLLVRMNGLDPSNHDYMKANQLDIDLRNVHDQATIYYLPQKTDITSVKQKGMVLSGRVLAVDRAGWYSILIVDKDVNKKFYHIFISPQG